MDYGRLYKMFDDCFPINADCGMLCSQACCKGDLTTGMLLFPGESTALPVRQVNGKVLAVCNGTCDRAARPLSCRLFPLFPVVDEKGKINVSVDYRGLGICPMVAHGEDVAFDRQFIRRVKKAGKILCRDETCHTFIKEISDEILEQKKLARLFK